MSELSPRFEPPEDRPKPTEPDQPPEPEPHADDLFAEPERGVIDRVANTMERDERRGPERFDASVTSVIDRAAATMETDRPALEAVCNEVGRELHDRMPLDRWQAADVHERAELAQEAHDLSRECYGLTPRPLEISSELEEYELGLFTPRTGEVMVNARLLSESTPDELLNTIAHENQHAAQEDVLQDRVPHPLGDRGKSEVEAWREGTRTYDPADIRGQGYAYNPLEVDANNAGAQVVDGYKDARIEALEGQIQDKDERIAALEAQEAKLEARIQAGDDRVASLEVHVKRLEKLVEDQAARPDTLDDAANHDPNERPKP